MTNETLLKIQQELKAPKSQTNSFGGYKYRSCEDILEAVKPILAKLNATITLSDDLILVGERYYVKATATLTDKEGSISVSALAREEDTKKGMDQSQITGSCSSYARKYALNGLFAIDDTKDSDFTNKGDNEPKKETKTSQVLPDTSDLSVTESQLNELKGYGIKVEDVCTYYKVSITELKFNQVEAILNKKRKQNKGN